MRKFIPLAAVVAVAGASAAAIPAFAATKTVSVKDNFFSPKSLTVSKGTTVKWIFKGKVAHNVTVTKGPVKFHSRTMQKGSFSKRLTKKGVYTIVCTIHAGMTSKIRVK